MEFIKPIFIFRKPKFGPLGLKCLIEAWAKKSS